MVFSDLNFARIIAAAFAVGGVVQMMIASAPSWPVVTNAFFCLVMFAGFSVAALLKPSAGVKRRGYSPKAPELRLITSQPVGKPPELLPSRLPELSSHVERRRWRGRYNVDEAERPQASPARPK